MATITKPSDYNELLLKPEMFGKNDTTYPDFVQGVIDDQAEILEGRVGSTAYASASKPKSTYVKQAEKCLVSAELLIRRKNKILENVAANGQEPLDTTALDSQIQLYAGKAEGWISRVVSDTSADAGDEMASGVVVTTHFGSAA